MILGLNVSHDASAALLTDEGYVLGAIAEERISRVKNHDGFPWRAINFLLSNIESDSLNRLIIGSHGYMSDDLLFHLFSSVEKNPSYKEGYRFPFPPGYQKSLKKQITSHEMGINFLLKELTVISELDCQIEYVQHHDGHLGCTLPYRQEAQLMVSLDGFGDGQSGAISLYSDNEIKNLARFADFDSLGYLYSLVTGKYNFSMNKHEGKITGLAAFGKYSEAVEVLSSHIETNDGLISLKIPRGHKSLIIRAIKRLGLNRKAVTDIHSLIDLAAECSPSFPDLAYAIQNVLENSIIEIIEYYVTRYRVNSIALAGGVFANVKLNQRISDCFSPRPVFVFPNMGDGGLALGGPWHLLHAEDKLRSDDLFESMYLAPTDNRDSGILEFMHDPALKISQFPEEDCLAKEVVDYILNGSVVGIFSGQMEFGPRALGNRSILLDPRDSKIVEVVNRRLHRTEFMPFAPIVLAEDFESIFETNNTALDPFRFMAMTSNVKHERRDLLPAVTHIDGTARPQITSTETNRLVIKILKETKKRMGFGILVNTSFNRHEEPIVYTLSHAVQALKDKSVDIIFTDTHSITLAY